MQENVIQNLPEILKKHICTLKKASRDMSNEEPMSESKIKVINFDKIPKEYAREKGLSCIPKSNDALYVSLEKTWYFMEFKNGSISKEEIYRKIYDSVIISVEMGIFPNFDYVRKNVQYILIYNSEKYDKVSYSESRKQTYGYFMKRAKCEEKLFGVENFEGFLLQETHTYDKELFHQKFVKKMEQQEMEQSK